MVPSPSVSPESSSKRPNLLAKTPLGKESSQKSRVWGGTSSAARALGDEWGFHEGGPLHDAKASWCKAAPEHGSKTMGVKPWVNGEE
jgi:hypothetical protein